MAKRVHDACKKENLLFETGTSVTRVWRIWCLRFCAVRKRPCVVATNTLSLQEQLLEKDIPALRKILIGFPDLRMTDLNVLCWWGGQITCARSFTACSKWPNRAFEAGQRGVERSRGNENPVEGIRQEMSPLRGAECGIWSMRTHRFVRVKLFSAKLFYRKARARVESSDLVVVNHSLLFL